MAEYSIVWMSHSCFIHSSIDGHLGCFHVLAIVNNAAMNTGVLLFFRISVLGYFGYMPRSGIAGSKGSPFLIFRDISILLSTVAAPVCIPTNSAKWFPFLHVLVSACCLLIYCWQPIWQVWDDISVWFVVKVKFSLLLLGIFCSCHLWCSDRLSACSTGATLGTTCTFSRQFFPFLR